MLKALIDCRNGARDGLHRLALQIDEGRALGRDVSANEADLGRLSSILAESSAQLERHLDGLYRHAA